MVLARISSIPMQQIPPTIPRRCHVFSICSKLCINLIMTADIHVILSLKQQLAFFMYFNDVIYNDPLAYIYIIYSVTVCCYTTVHAQED